MGRTCLQFSENELFELWRPFANDPDHGAEALCGFAGLPDTAPAKAVLPLILKFQERLEKETDRELLNELGLRQSTL